MPSLTLAERVAVNENRFVNVHAKLDKMDFKLDRIVDAMPEITRKVENHHAVFHQHVELLKKIDKPPCMKSEGMIPNGNGGYVERRTPPPKKTISIRFDQLPLIKKISTILGVVSFTLAYGYWLVVQLHSALEWLMVTLK